jgi:hypothetical protein
MLRLPAKKRSSFLRAGLVAASALVLFATSAALLPALGADPAIPELMLPSTAGWTGFIVRGTDPSIYLPEDYLQGRASIERAISLGAPAAKVTAYLQGRTFNEWIAPVGGIGPISDGPEHPFYNNNVAQVVGKNPSYRIADLTSEAARNLMPWALEAVKKQNAIVLAGKNGETRQARCWETGVPNIHEAPQSLYFIQTPKEVVMYQGGRVRHVYLNVAHSRNPEPSWYGESVGHYEGDSLVIDTIGLNDKTVVDIYRTPHTESLHVVERWHLIDGGKTMEAVFTVDDPGSFYKPWTARRRYRRIDQNFEERICAENNSNNLFDYHVPVASKSDF